MLRSFSPPLTAFILTISLLSTAHAEDESRLFSQWNVSGYANLKAKAPNGGNTAIELDDLSIFLSANINDYINPFIEAEMFEVPLWEEADGLQFDRANFIIERLYNDFKITDDITLRGGKFLTPLNHWNLIHAAPLVWTVNRPLASRYSYANYITGFKLRYDFDWLSGHAVEFYWQPDGEFMPKPLDHQDRDYKGVFGARWTLHEDLDAYYGLSMQRADVKGGDETRTTWSFDTHLQFDLVELESQLLITDVDTRVDLPHDTDWGGYLQTAVPVGFDLNILSRYEYYQFAEYKTDHHALLGGVVYRPTPDYSFKLEWQQTWGTASHNPTGLFASIAVMF